MQLKKYQIVTLSIFFFIACSVAFLILALVIVQIAAASPQSHLTINVRPAEPAPTPTPFQPDNAMVEDEVTTGEVAVSTEEMANPPGEILPQPEQTQTPVPTVAESSIPKRQVNILLLGSDWRPESGYRTDVIILISLDPMHNTVTAVSFPRDLYVQIPGWQMNRINTAHQVGGFELLADTFEYNFGIRPDYYFMVNFQGFKRLVDSLGGIDVNASQNLSDQCSDINNTGWCSVGPGVVHMDSTTALWYVRSRYSTSDFDRTRRAQEVIQAIFNKSLSLNALTKVPELYNIYTEYVETNMRVADILPLLPMASTMQNPENVRRFAVGPNQGYDWITGEGAWVFVPDYYLIYDLLAEALYLDE